MPYVSRGFHEEITGVFTHKHDQAKEFLPDDHPDVVAFNERMNRILGKIPPAKPLTEKEIKKQGREQKKLEQEHEKLRNALELFRTRFSELEIALSTLLYEVLHLNNRNSKVPYALYYSPTSFHARVELVENAVVQLSLENDELKQLPKLWETISRKLHQARNVRNAISHAAPNTLVINNKRHARMTSPAFDVLRVGRTISKRQIPGLTAKNIVDGNKNLKLLHHSADAVNRVVGAFHAKAPKALREKFRELRASLKKLDNQ